MSSQPPHHVPFLIGPEDADTACLLIHGFSGTPTEMRALGDALAHNGIRAYGMLVAGHSGDPEALVRSNRKQWIASAEEALSQLASYPHVFVAGLSMGGVLSLLLAARHPERIAGVITMSTPTRISGGWQVNVLPIVRYFMRWYYPLAQLNFADATVQADVLKQARMRDPNVSIDFTNEQVVQEIKQMVRLPIPAIAELLALTNQGRRSIKKLRTPLLIIHSKQDQTVNPSCAEELYRLAQATPVKSLHWLEHSDHVITVGPERETVFKLALTFMKHAAPGETFRSVDAHQVEPDGTPPDR